MIHNMEGLYEQIINRLFRQKIEEDERENYYIGKKKIGQKEAVLHLTKYLSHIIEGVVERVAVDDEGVKKSMDFVNSVIKSLGRDFDMADLDDNLVDAEAYILTSIINKAKCDNLKIDQYIKDITPITSLTSSSLFTGRSQTVNMISELKKEILSSDKIDILVSFIRLSGLEMMLKELKAFTTKGNELRVITTTYMRATEYEAIRELAKLPNTTIKISYNTETTRLHAKAYIFCRNTGYHTAYIGSSNISKSALTDGLEWNIKATQMELPHIINEVKNTFETYWHDEEFVTYDEQCDASRLKAALGKPDTPDLDYSFLDLIRAKDYQNEVLEQLDVERNLRGHFRNLVVAATGTGKTVIAAFDYKRFREQNPRANLLFVVHREEIVKQACEKFRMVLEDENFGDTWYGGHEASNISCVFASKDLLNNRIDSLPLPDDYYDYMIVDEAHHVVAQSYQKILNKFKPKVLLGLTATPERMDLRDITQYFDNTISAEIRLDTALNNQLLSPFRYFGVTDCVDLADVKWDKGRFDAYELSQVYTSNDYRTKIIFDALQKYVPAYNDVRALCFCVNKEHAAMMQAKFQLAGLRSAMLTDESSKSERRTAVSRLTEKKINYLFVVDIFNEGVDIPYIDTVLFLRPTESITVFLQQFGRGLRKAKGKEYLTVLDFVGHSRAEFNYMERFRALMGRTPMSVGEEIEHGFPHLPFGCQIYLEEKAREYIIENIKQHESAFHQNKLVQLVARFAGDYDAELTLSNFVRLNKVPIEVIYKGRTWNKLCEMAGVTNVASSFNEELSRAVSKKWLSTDSHSYFSFINRLAERGFVVKVDDMSFVDRQRLLMFYYDLFDRAGCYATLQEMVDALAQDKVFAGEVKDVTTLMMQRCEALEMPDNSSLNLIMPLRLHGVYTKGQIQVAIQTSTLQKKSSSREGCERNEIRGASLEAMYVDIIKDREAGSTTNYNDFAMDSEIFHWESQNNVRESSGRGQEYIKGSRTMLLFVRKQNKSMEDKGRTMGFVYLGEVKLVSHEGERPMKIVWKLKTPMPASVCEYARKYAM